MGHTIEAGCGIREIRGTRAGYGMELSGGVWDSFEIDSDIRDLSIKRPFENLTRRHQDKYSESCGMTE